VIAAHDTSSAVVAKAATTTIPIVFATGSDPVRDGLVASLNRPGGNITGVSTFVVEMEPKRLELVRELRPHATTTAVLVNPENTPQVEIQVGDIQAAARSVGQEITILNARTIRDIETAFATLAQMRSPFCTVTIRSLTRGQSAGGGSFAGERLEVSVVKRSIVIAGHKTSVSLEDGFWNSLKEIASERAMTLQELVGAIDANRNHTNLSSAIRLFVLGFYRDQNAPRQTAADVSLGRPAGDGGPKEKPGLPERTGL
jgi:predicted DNA-binding ribbon-helix-helix protein